MTNIKSHTYKLCPKCDYFCNTKEEKNYCPNCGTKLKTECDVCRNPITYPYAKYCGICGSPYKPNPENSSLKEIK
ncbi:MAG: hypothetical protein V1720_17340 [bacterium]